MKTGKINIIFSLISLLILLILFMINKADYNVVLLIATVTFAFMFYSWIKVASILNFYTIFLGSCFVFYYGQYLVYFITGESISRWMSITSNFPASTMNGTAIYILRCILTLHIGILLCYDSKKAKMINASKQNNSNENCDGGLRDIKIHRLASSVFFFVTYIPAMLVGVYKAALTSALNYSELLGYNIHIFGNPIDQIIRLLASFAIASFIYVIISHSGSNRIRLFALLMLLYIGVYYLSGSRLKVTLFILIALLIYNDLFKRISKKQALMMIPIAFVALVVIGGIGATRSSFSTYGSIQGIIGGIFENFAENNIFISLLNEFGMTAVVITNVVAHCPAQVGFLWGKSYLFSL